MERHSAAGAILLASIPPTGAAKTALKVARRYPRKFLEANLRLTLRPIIETPEMARGLFFSASMPAAQVAAYHDRLQDESYFAFLDMVAFDLVRRKKMHRVPMLVLAGANDALPSPRQIRQTAHALGADVEIFRDMAHDLMLEPGWKLAAKRMIDWLDAKFA